MATSTRWASTRCASIAFRTRRCEPCATPSPPTRPTRAWWRWAKSAWTILCAGLDRERQAHFYVEQLRLAREFDLPVILHVRRSADSLLKQLRRWPVRGGLAHAFNGSEQQARAFIDLGFKLGFGGALTFERALQIRRLAAALPLESLVLETDAPDIPPHWLYRTAAQRAAGETSRNEPGELPRIGAELAALRGLSAPDLARATSANAVQALPRLAAAVPHRCSGRAALMARPSPPGAPWAGAPRLVGLGTGARAQHPARRAGQLSRRRLAGGAAVLRAPAQPFLAHPLGAVGPRSARVCRTPNGSRSCAQRGLGLWDVYASCSRVGSLDSAIQDAQFNDLASLRRRAPALSGVAHNGGESARARHVTLSLGVPVLRLPSTSPANASWSFERKLAAWRGAFEQHDLL